MDWKCTEPINKISCVQRQYHWSNALYSVILFLENNLGQEMLSRLLVQPLFPRLGNNIERDFQAFHTLTFNSRYPYQRKSHQSGHFLYFQKCSDLLTCYEKGNRQ